MSHKKDKEADLRFDDNPLHTGVTKDTASTPGYFRLLLPGLAARYVLRWAIGASPDIAQDLQQIGIQTPLPNEAREIIAQVKTLSDQAVGRLSQSNGRKLGFERNQQVFHDLWKSEEAQAIKVRLNRQGITSKALDKALVSRTFMELKGTHRRDFDGLYQHQTDWDDFCKRVEGKIAANQTTRWYDNALGAGSVLLTGFYANRVASDIKKVFAETVAYEFDKDPKHITYRDIWSSNNQLVREVRNNFITKNLSRVGTDALFFIGNLAHLPKMGWINKYSFSDLGVGIKGAQLVGEVLNKQTTIFVDLIQLIDNKMNPLKGLGAPITVGDTFDLYQKYTQSHDSQATFRDALSGQNHDGRDWDKAQAIFKRVTELMNLTYKYKHIGRQPSETEQAQADFALPKFLYLLGNGLIDTYKPEETLAYIEVANAYGIPAVRQLQRILERGIPVDQALVNYPEELRRKVLQLREHPASEETPPPPFTAVPTTSIHHPVEAVAMRAAPSLQMSAL